MTEEQQERYLDDVQNDKHFCSYYDEIMVLLGTGLRISEMMDLTFSDLDFKEQKIRVDYQLPEPGVVSIMWRRPRWRTVCGSST